jgi:hypothetical protein
LLAGPDPASTNSISLSNTPKWSFKANSILSISFSLLELSLLAYLPLLNFLTSLSLAN